MARGKRSLVTPAGKGVARSLRRLAYGVVLTAGVLLVLVVLGGVAIGGWLLVNADQALAWITNVAAQLQPVLSIFTTGK